MLSMKHTQMIALVLVGTLVLAGCGNMQEQPRLETYDPSPNFGTAAREILPEAVPVGFQNDNTHLAYGEIDGELAETFPFEITAEVIAEGQRQYEGFCTPCHGFDGGGEGVIALKGYPQPASYHTDYLREQPVGHIYQVIANGKGQMYSYGSRLSVEERWAVVAYVRALQYSQYAPLTDLPEELRAEFVGLD